MKQQNVLLAGALSLLLLCGNTAAATEPTASSKKQEVEETFFEETFGRLDYSKAASVNLKNYSGYDMKSPVTYTYTGKRKQIEMKFQEERFPENFYYLTFSPHNGEASANKSLRIAGIESSQHKDLLLRFDFAAGSKEMTIDQLTLLCNGVEVPLPTQTVKNRDRFEPVAVPIPNGTTEIELLVNQATVSYLRIDNIAISGITTK